MRRQALIAVAALALGGAAGLAASAIARPRHAGLVVSCRWVWRHRSCRLVRATGAASTPGNITAAATTTATTTTQTATAPASLPSRLEVDEQEWSVVPTHD